MLFGPFVRGLLRPSYFSFFINLLAFVGPLYMLQVYDRVLGSRNIGTLVALTIIAGFLLIVYSLLEKIRSSILVRLGLLFADKAKVPLFDTVLRGTLVQPGTSHVQALQRSGHDAGVHDRQRLDRIL